MRKLAGEVRVPAKSTVHAVIDLHGLVSQAKKRNRANKAVGTPLSDAAQPNDLWKAGSGPPFLLPDLVLMRQPDCGAPRWRSTRAVDAFIIDLRRRDAPGLARNRRP
jgi:hypothetical protein